ncbi:reverse transcriptase [Gossypium australe]|uniref:Reverse transcriptase n=1 Tax=Gossypium australe TaxID=47621 RepID=A0A5B6WGJ4_9ROSI|nr:reverse transcriptase [Gossypium australe]
MDDGVAKLEESMGSMKESLKMVEGNIEELDFARDESKGPKLRKLKRTKSVRDVNNFLWGMEQYFRAIGIKDDAAKVNITSMYFTNVAPLWWHRMYTTKKCGAITIGTLVEFQS